ncbi:MAG: hypothetical protein D6816_18610 [Bacteroidetes bacterium]|nr:MAG: hypothetical protein D6816_18610 [Bacteroidota bacterium]
MADMADQGFPGSWDCFDNPPGHSTAKPEPQRFLRSHHRRQPTGTSDGSIELPPLPPGIHFLRFSSEKESFALKLVMR